MMGRGRPKLAAQSIEEALARLQAGEIPPRPRNDIERIVFGKPRGRRANGASPTQLASQVANYLQKADGISAAAAARKAAEAYGVNVDNVRKYMRRAAAAPLVEVLRMSWAGSLPEKVSLVRYIRDAPPED